MQRFLLSFFIFIPVFSSAQPPEYAKILNDPDVIWAAEINQHYFIEPEHFGDSVLGRRWYDNKSTLLKKSTNATSRPDYQKHFGKYLIQLFHDKSIPVYDGQNLEEPLSDSLRNLYLYYVGDGADSITVIDPVTFLEHNVRVENTIDPKYLQVIGLRQLLFFNKQTDQFDLYTYAWAPYCAMTQFIDGERNLRFMRPIFWFKMPPYSKKKQRKVPNLENSDITWARRVETGSKFFQLDSMATFKDFEAPIMQRILKRVRTDKSYTVKEGLDWTDIGFEERLGLIEHVDTTVTFDPETYEEIVQVEHHKMQGEEIMRLKIQQDLFWDDRKKELIVRPFAFAPIQKLEDKVGNFRFYQPIFWRQVR